MNIPNILIGGVPAITIVISLIMILRPRLNPSWLPVLAILLGIIVALAAYATQVWPDIKGWIDAIVAGILIGLASVGVNEVGKHGKRLSGGNSQLLKDK